MYYIIIPPAKRSCWGMGGGGGGGGWGYVGFIPSVRASVCPSVYSSVPHPVFALWHLQFSLDLFHIYTSYQTTSKGVSRVMLIAKLFLAVFLNIYNFDFVLFWLWDLMWITSMDNHWVAGVSQNASILVVPVIPECKCICPQRIHFTPDCLNAHTCTPNVCLYLRNVSATCWLTKDWLLWVSIVYSTVLFVLRTCVYLYMMISRRFNKILYTLYNYTYILCKATFHIARYSVGMLHDCVSSTFIINVLLVLRGNDWFRYLIASSIMLYPCKPSDVKEHPTCQLLVTLI